jgi:hypothetical protein
VASGLGAAALRVWSELPKGARDVLEDELSPTDLQTLLLDLSKTRADRLKLLAAATVAAGPVRAAFADRSASGWLRLICCCGRMLPPQFVGLALSPVTPLATCAAVEAADQNRVLSTVRSSEVVSNPTNVLALEAAVRRRAGADVVHSAACHRVLRNRRFDGPGGRPHFELFALVSSARDSGSARTQAELLVVHLRFWSEVLSVLLGPNSGLLDLTVINDATLRDRVDDTGPPGSPRRAAPRPDPGHRLLPIGGLQDRSRRDRRRARSGTAASLAGQRRCLQTLRNAA